MVGFGREAMRGRWSRNNWGDSKKSGNKNWQDFLQYTTSYQKLPFFFMNFCTVQHEIAGLNDRKIVS